VKQTIILEGLTVDEGDKVRRYLSRGRAIPFYVHTDFDTRTLEYHSTVSTPSKLSMSDRLMYTYLAAGYLDGYRAAGVERG
jgi:hypothetical protein